MLSDSETIHQQLPTNNLWGKKRLALGNHCFSSFTGAKALVVSTITLYMPRGHFFLINVKGHRHAHMIKKEIYYLLSSPVEKSYSRDLRLLQQHLSHWCHASKKTGVPRGRNDRQPWQKHWMSGTLSVTGNLFQNNPSKMSTLPTAVDRARTCWDLQKKKKSRCMSQALDQ